MKRDPSAAVLDGAHEAAVPDLPPGSPNTPTLEPALVVHVVGNASESVLNLLRNSLRSSAAYGLECSVVLIDKDANRHCLVHLDDSAELFLVSHVRNPFSQWRAVARTIDTLLQTDKPQSFHLHGLLPSIVGVLTLHRAGSGAPVYFSLYGFRTLNFLGMCAARALARLKSVLQSAAPAPITYVPQEKHALQIWNGRVHTAGVSHGAHPDECRHESLQPLIIAGGHGQGPHAAELFSQLAVLLNGGENHIGFQWIGQAAQPESDLLRAAGVRMLGMDGEDHALHLALSWIYLGTDTTPGFPIALLSAMAMGLPCVALDCEQHRKVISHGETGYLCADVQEFLECICALLEDKSMRLRLGKAAQRQAVLQFNASSLGRRLFAAYALRSTAEARLYLKGKS